MNNKRSRTQKGGFTLAEILIAVAIASLIVAAVFAIFIQTRRQIHSQKTRSDMYQNLRFAMIGLLEGIFEAVKEKYDPNADLRGVMDELDLFVKVGEPTGKVD